MEIIQDNCKFNLVE